MNTSEHAPGIPSQGSFSLQCLHQPQNWKGPTKTESQLRKSNNRNVQRYNPSNFVRPRCFPNQAKFPACRQTQWHPLQSNLTRVEQQRVGELLAVHPPFGPDWAMNHKHKNFRNNVTMRAQPPRSKNETIAKEHHLLRKVAPA
jgi:hypothetical protein